MGVGVFGKLPARRDYVQHGVDPRLMELLDPWLQRALADSRQALGQGWLDAWLQAPIWRFWLGERIAGRTVLGALMPSVDGVGRYFPLCLLGAYDRPVPPPEADEQAPWFEAAEDLMLGALAEGGTYEDLLAGLSDLPTPVAAHAPEAPATGVCGAFAARRREMLGQFYDRYSCWWAPSPDDQDGAPSRLMIRVGMPDPGEFAGMIAPADRPQLAEAIGGN